LLWPMVILATIATIIASQALISGTFAIISQAISYNLFPRFRIYRTSKHHYGQCYIAEINWVLMAMTLGLMVGFQTSAALTPACIR